MLETPDVVTVNASDLAHRLGELRALAAAGTWVRIIHGSKPDAPPLWLTATPPAWFDGDDLPHLRELVRASRAIGGRREQVPDK